MRMPSRETLSFAAVLLAALWGAAGASAEVGPLVLPDNRAWEQVSPVDKNGNDIGFGSAMAALDGSRLLYSSQGPFAGAQSAIGVDGIRYMATRTPNGWSTESLMPPGGTFTLGWNGYQGFTEDLSKGVMMWMEDEITGTVDPQAQFGANLYMRDTATGSFRLLNGNLSAVGQGSGFVWGSSDFSKLAIDTNQALTPDSPCGGISTEHCAYEWDKGQLRLASVVDGEAVTGTVGNQPQQGSSEHAMSDDGKRLFFGHAAAGAALPGQLYVREDGATTKLISSSERTLPGGASGDAVRFQDAEAAHGDRVLFSTRNSLLDADTDATNDLYLYDFTRPEGERLSLVSEDHNSEVPGGADVDGGFFTLAGGVLGAAEDLRRVYFVANNQILPDEPTAPGPKLYLWDDTDLSPELTYIATLSDDAGPFGHGDLYDWSTPTLNREFVKQSRVSRDGRYLAFPSWAKLSEAAVEGRQEIYRYDAVAHSLDCISCSADQFPAEPPKSADEGDLRFALKLYGTKPWNHLSRNVTDSGQVFFETSRGLVPRDSNGKVDVYEYEDGTLHLISPGTGEHDSLFLDATPSGSDVFFITADRLVGWDRDNSYDAYDARVGGGLPEPPPPPPPCEGDACQPPPLLRTRASLGSASFEGPANSQARKRRPRCRQRKGSKKKSARAKQADTGARARHRRKCGAKRSHAKGKGR